MEEKEKMRSKEIGKGLAGGRTTWGTCQEKEKKNGGWGREVAKYWKHSLKNCGRSGLFEVYGLGDTGFGRIDQVSHQRSLVK